MTEPPALASWLPRLHRPLFSRARAGQSGRGLPAPCVTVSSVHATKLPLASAVVVNVSKKPLFTVEERQELSTCLHDAVVSFVDALQGRRFHRRDSHTVAGNPSRLADGPTDQTHPAPVGGHAGIPDPGKGYEGVTIREIAERAKLLPRPQV